MKTNTKTLSIMDCEFCFTVPGDSHIIDMINPITGLSWINGDNLEQVQARCPGAVIMSFDDYMKALDQRENTPIAWNETTEEQYDYALDVLPPAYMGNLGFLVGEPMDHFSADGRPRYEGYRRINGKYLVSSRPLTIAEFKAVGR